MANTIAVAALEHAGLHAAQSASYGSATRGGYSRGDVVVSDEAVDFPWLIAADVLVCMDQRALDTDLYTLKPDGMLLVEAAMIQDEGRFKGQVYRVPATELGEKAAGASLYASSVILGVLDGLLTWLRPGALEKAIAARSPSRAREQNLAGWAAGKEYYASVLAGSL